jgi:hypothetical protein
MDRALTGKAAVDTSAVTRFEVIDQAVPDLDGSPSRFTRLGVSVELSLQDGGRTLKVFLTESPVPAGLVEAQMKDGWRMK